jgi:2-alkyl-3-oxoalkanoate reductase
MTRVFVAGATGAIGRRLVPQLADRGYEVFAMTRTRAKTDSLREAGAHPVIGDGLDRVSTMQAVMGAEPEVVINEMTALTGVMNLRHFDRQFARTNRLRTEGTDNLLEAARAAGARRFVAQSFGNWYAPGGPPVKTEEDPLDSDPPASQRESLSAIRHLERAVLGADDLEGVVLRYTSLYGPGTALADDGEIVRLVRKRQFPLIGDGLGIWSFVHVDDAAGATVAAVERGEPGIYNVADDEPAPTAEWLPELARIVGAPSPRHVPVWLGRLLGGEAVASMFTRIRGAANDKAKRDLGWAPRYASWREGFRDGLSAHPSSSQAEALPRL